MDDTKLDRLKQRFADEILGNESLADGLETEASTFLVHWGIAIADRIAHQVGKVEDIDEEVAEGLAYPRLYALRRWMRLVNRYARYTDQMDLEAKKLWMEEMLTQASLAYGEDFHRPDKADCLAFLENRFENPLACLQALRNLFVA